MLILRYHTLLCYGFILMSRRPSISTRSVTALPFTSLFRSVLAELRAEVMERGRLMVGALNRRVAERRMHVEGLGRGLPQPQRLLEDKTDRKSTRLNSSH